MTAAILGKCGMGRLPWVRVVSLACGLLICLPAAAQASFGPLAPVSLTTNGNGGRALVEATAVALSPDGKNAYVASQSGDFGGFNDSGVAVFSRDPAGGGLTQLPGLDGCTTVTGADATGGTTCRSGNGLDGSKTVVVSPDGKFVYVGSGGDNNVGPGPYGAIAIFSRNPTTGALTQLAGTAGCIGSGTDPACSTGSTNLSDISDLKISSDGRFLYAAAAEGNNNQADNGAVSVFSRDTTTGALTQQQCMEYVPNGSSSSTGCTVARAMLEPTALALSPDDNQLYVAASEGTHPSSPDRPGAVVTFNRSSATGLLTQPSGAAGCIDETGTDNTTGGGTVCGVGRALHDAHGIAVSPDGRSLYVAAQGENSSGAGGSALGAVALFSRDTTSGTVTQLAGSAGCISEDGSNGYSSPSPGTCTTGRALFEPSGVQVSPDGQSVYVASSDPSSSIDVFTRDPSTSGLAQVAGSGGCLSEDGGDGHASTCTQAAGLGGVNGLAVATGATSATCSFVYFAAEDRYAVGTLARQPDCTAPAPPPPSPTAPLVTTGPATAVSLHAATLTGSVTPRGSATTYRFDFGLTNAYGAQTLPVAAGGGTAPVSASAGLTGLQNGVVYHYRIEATNAGGTTYGQDMTFSTPLSAITRVKPAGLTVTTRPRHPSHVPFTLTTRGRLILPKGVSRAQGCTGFVAVHVKIGRLTVSNRRTRLRKDCSYRARVRFSVRRRLGSRGTLKVRVHFLGNQALLAADAKQRRVRYG